MPTPSQFDPVEEVLNDIRAGRLVIVTDDADRENEGDLICAAESVTPDMVNFMLRQGAGVLCAPMTEETARRLSLTPMVDRDANTSAHQTPFLIPVDHALSFALRVFVRRSSSFLLKKNQSFLYQDSSSSLSHLLCL